MRFICITLLLASLAACASPVAWRGNPVTPSPKTAPAAPTDLGKEEDRELPPPSGVRPCCIFGTDVKVDVGKVEVPLFELQNVVSVSELGRHQYDNGSNPLAVDDKGVFVGENNGLVFTCQAGFVDVAHVRDYADMTLFLASRLDACLDGGCVIPLSDEGGDRYVVVSPPPASARAPKQRLATLIALARWTAFQLSIWHEIATGSGWSAFEAFPELASAFSPEDMYSNALGTELGARIVEQQLAKSEGAYNEAMTEQLAALLKQLGAASPDETRAVLKDLDGAWWDSSQRLPSTQLVRLRSFATGPAVRPVELPREVARSHCANDRKQRTITLPTRVGGRKIDDLVTIYVEVARSERLRLPDTTPPWITQKTFPSLLAAVRAALAKEAAR